METRSNQVLVGSVVLGLLVAIALFMVWLSGVSGSNTKTYDIFFKQSVEGLAKGSTVTFSGVPSGQITAIELWKDNPEFKRVRVELKKETPILQGTTATILGSFTGPSTVVLDGAIKGAPPITDPGPGGVPVIPTKRGGLGALLNSAPQLLERISTLTERLTEVLNDKNQKSISGILANVDRLSDSLADRGPEIAATLAETRVAVKQAGIAAEKIGNLAQTVDGQAGPLVTDLRTAIASANRSMNSLDATLKDAQPGVQAFSKQTLPEVGQLVRDLRVMAESLTAVAGRIDQGGAGSLIGSPRLPDYKPKGDRKMIRPIALCALLTLGGCVSFGPKAPKTLMILTTSATVPTESVRQASAENTVLILTPTATAAVATVRIPVYDGATMLSYVADGAWNEAPARAMQRLMSETVTARTAKIVLDPRQYGASPAMRLSGQLQRFGIDPGAMQAVVVFDAQLSREAGKVETRRFEAKAPVAAIDAPQSGAALNRAANDVAAQVADWVK